MRTDRCVSKSVCKWCNVSHVRILSLALLLKHIRKIVCTVLTSIGDGKFDDWRYSSHFSASKWRVSSTRLAYFTNAYYMYTHVHRVYMLIHRTSWLWSKIFGWLPSWKPTSEQLLVDSERAVLSGKASMCLYIYTCMGFQGGFASGVRLKCYEIILGLQSVQRSLI